MNAARRHLALLWPDGLPEGVSAYVWWKPEKGGGHSFWSEDLDELAAKALELAPDCDVYFGVNAGPRPASNEERGKRLSVAEVTVMTGLVADFDVGKGWKDGEQIDAFLDSLGSLHFPTSLRVDSGSGGRHAYWLWKEPWVFEGDDDRRDAGAIARGWAAFLEEQAQGFLDRKEKIFDSVHDLARLLRLAGTKNHKESDPRPVRLLASDRRPRYNSSDFELFFEEEAPRPVTDDRQRAVAAAVLGSCRLNLDPQAVGDADLVECFCSESIDFRKSWNRKRRGWSQSQYDMSLMTLALTGWPRSVSLQQAIDIAMHHRREGGGLQKKALRDGRQRPDYWIQYTLTKAILAHERRVRGELESGEVEPEARPLIQAILHAVGRPKAEETESPAGKTPEAPAPQDEDERRVTIRRLAADPSASRESRLKRIRDALGFPSLSRILQFVDTFDVELTTGRRLNIGSIRDFRSQAKWMDLVLLTHEEGGRLGTALKGREWSDLLNLMMYLVEKRPSEDAESRAITQAWVRSFMSTVKGSPTKTTLVELLDPSGKVGASFEIDDFDQNGQACRLFCFRSSELLTHVKTQLREKVSPSELVARLEGAGFWHRQFQGRVAGVNRNVKRWAIARADLLDEDLPDVHPGTPLDCIDVDDTTN